MKDFLSDMLTRIRNGQRAGLDAVYLHPYMPKMCKAVLKLLVEEGYIRGFSEYDATKITQNKIKVFLKYKNNGAPVIEGLFRVSTPGRRIYISTKTL
jgi:small subunit ribosomal protein S8